MGLSPGRFGTGGADEEDNAAGQDSVTSAVGHESLAGSLSAHNCIGARWVLAAAQRTHHTWGCPPRARVVATRKESELIQFSGRRSGYHSGGSANRGDKHRLIATTPVPRRPQSRGSPPLPYLRAPRPGRARTNAAGASAHSGAAMSHAWEAHMYTDITVSL